MKLRPLCAALALAGGTALAVAGCDGAPAPTAGYVYSFDYESASTLVIPGYSVSGSCYSSGYCSSGYWVPGTTLFFPESWSVELCTEQGGPGVKGNDCGWQDVDERTYHAVRLNTWYDTEGNQPS